MRFISNFLPLIFLGLFQISYSQDNSQLSGFTIKVEAYFEKIANEAGIDRYKTYCNKISLKGSFDNNGKTFRQTIKFYKSGLKKEHTKIYGKSMGIKFLIADLIRFNDKIFYAKIYEIKKLGKQKYIRLTEETLFNEAIYNRRVLVKE